MSPTPPEPAIATFIAKYSPEIAVQIRDARTRLQALFPRGYEMVYDNYNALVFGFGPTDRVSDAILSLAAYPRWVTLFFLKGAALADPQHRLAGSGTQVRSIVLSSPEDIEAPTTLAFIAQAARPAQAAFDRAPPRSTLIKSVSAKQRPRRPGTPDVRPKRGVAKS